MTEKEMWAAYTLKYPCYKDKTYEVWCYGGNTPDLLAKLTLLGIKTATSSAYPFYEYEKCELPKVGEHNIILDTNGLAVCITKTTNVNVVPFWQVSAEHAYKEGEGDRNLQYWKDVHKKFFTEELFQIDKNFTEDMLVVCEEFKVVFSS